MTSSSGMVGGGVRGMDVGIVHMTIAQVGDPMRVFHLFMEEYHRDGERTTETIAGKVENGTTNE